MRAETMRQFFRARWRVQWLEGGGVSRIASSLAESAVASLWLAGDLLTMEAREGCHESAEGAQWLANWVLGRLRGVVVLPCSGSYLLSIVSDLELAAAGWLQDMASAGLSVAAATGGAS